MTTYTKRTNARRAGLKAGIPSAQIEITVHKQDGEVRFGFKRKETQAVAPAQAITAVKRAPAATTAAKPREQRNGVKRPAAGGLCAQVWAWLDSHPDATIVQAREVAPKKGWNVNNAVCEFYQWRKFNGLARTSSPKQI